MRALFAALLLVHYRLEECAEDGRRYARPVKFAGLNEQAAHGGVKIRHTQGIAEEIAVHIGERSEILIKGCSSLILLSIERLEDPRQPGV